MNIYIPTEEECTTRFNPNYVAPSLEEMMEGATRTNLGHPQFGSDNGMYGQKQSDKQKKAVGQSAKERFTGVPKWYKVTNPVLNGKDNPRARKVLAEGVLYDTVTECCKAYGMKNHNAIRYRCKSDKWTEWQFRD
jgi:hypothetical protein